MRWDSQLKREVRRLRSKGCTYSEIGKTLHKRIPKSTLSYWCRGVKLPGFYRQKVVKVNARNIERARKMALMANRSKRQRFLERLRKKGLPLIKNLDQRDKRLLLAVFYLCEGAKHPSTRYLKFGSSNPDIIKFFLFLLKESFSIVRSKFRVEILCRADQDLEALVDYWQRATNIEKKLFYKPRIDRRTIGKKTKKKDYKGVCVIDYFDTSIQLELQLLGESLIRRGYSSAG